MSAPGALQAEGSSRWALGRTEIAAYVALAAALIGIAIVHAKYFDATTKGHDIYYVWRAVTELAQGQNPYEHELSGGMSVNQKYYGYFPLFLILGALSQWAGLHAYTDWLSFWRIVFAGFDVAIALVLFQAVRSRGDLLLAVFAAWFWAFNRWTLFVVQITNFDFLAIFFLVASLALLRSRTALALALFGISLSLKQVAIFLIPLYVAWLYRSAASADARAGKATLAEGLLPAAPGGRRAIRGLAVILAGPALLSLPFLLWDADAYIRCIIFSATRTAASHWGAPSLDAILGVSGLTAKLPMLGLMAIATLLVLRGSLGICMGGLLVMSTFVDFHSVFFVHYPDWVVPFVPLAAAEHLRQPSSSCGEQLRSR